jgi:hypothetical protein
LVSEQGESDGQKAPTHIHFGGKRQFHWPKRRLSLLSIAQWPQQQNRRTVDSLLQVDFALKNLLKRVL